jgi:hypothetical protein
MAVRVIVRGAIGAPILIACLAVNAWAGPTFNVTLDTSFLNGLPAVLAFDFLDGGTPSNSVTLSPLTSDGAQDSTSITGDVSGSGPWIFNDSSLFNELLVSFNPMGSFLSFSFTTTDNPPNPGPFPDAFSFFIVNTDLSTLITTDEPTGSNALFEYNLGEGANGLIVFTPDQTGISVLVTPVLSAPEPGSLALLTVALIATLVGGIRRSNEQRSPGTGKVANLV